MAYLFESTAGILDARNIRSTATTSTRMELSQGPSRPAFEIIAGKNANKWKCIINIKN
jgi:hypothetical protein